MSTLRMAQQTVPTTPPGANDTLYFDEADGNLKYVDSTGAVHVVATTTTSLAKWGQSGTAKFVGSGSPVGVVVPSAIGDLYVDDTTPALWQATGLADTDWVQLVGSDSGWVNLALLNSWETDAVARYRLLNGVVYMEVTLLDGTNAHFATLPVGYRPAADTSEFIPVIVTDSGTQEIGQVIVNGADGTCFVDFVPSAAVPTTLAGACFSFVQGS